MASKNLVAFILSQPSHQLPKVTLSMQLYMSNPNHKNPTSLSRNVDCSPSPPPPPVTLVSANIAGFGYANIGVIFVSIGKSERNMSLTPSNQGFKNQWSNCDWFLMTIDCSQQTSQNDIHSPSPVSHRQIEHPSTSAGNVELDLQRIYVHCWLLCKSGKKYKRILLYIQKQQTCVKFFLYSPNGNGCT